MTPMLVALADAVAPPGVAPWVWAIFGGVVLYTGKGVMEIIRGIWHAKGWIDKVDAKVEAKTPSKPPQPGSQTQTQQSSSSNHVYRDLGAHGATLEGLAEGQQRIESGLSDALNILRSHHGQLAAIKTKLWPDLAPSDSSDHDAPAPRPRGYTNPGMKAASPDSTAGRRAVRATDNKRHDDEGER